MIGTIFYPLSRVITAISLFFTTLFAGGGLAAALGNAPPSLDPLPYPNWVHQHWVWENEGDTDTVRAFVDGFTGRDIPVGAMVFDRPWEGGSLDDRDTVGTYLMDENRYWDFACPKRELDGKPDPNCTDCLLCYFQNRDIRVMLWASCMVNEDASNHAYAKEKGYFLNDGKVIKWWGGKGSMIDYTNPEAVKWWESQLDNMLNLGTDGWKLDGADPYVMLMLPAYGKGGHVGWKQYQKLQYDHFYNYTRSKGNEKVVLARPTDDVVGWGLPLTFASREINFVGWVGDQDNDWGGLRSALNQMFTSSLFNYVSYGSDIGGFRSGPADNPEDVFVRWAQMGAFTPIMENGGGGEHRPWIYDEKRGDGKNTVTDIYRNFVQLHYRLIPYIQSQVAYSYERRQPTMRPTLGYYQYMLGDDIFVAPMVDEGNDRRIVFPSGEWIYLFDETKTYKAGVKTLEFPYDEFPAFIRKGAIFPMGPVSLNDAEDFTTVHVYPVNGTRSFGLYEDGQKGSTLSYSKSGDALTLKSTATGRPLLWRINGASEPAEVKLDGTTLAKADSLDAVKADGGYCVAEGALWIAMANAKVGAEIVVK